MSLTIELDNDHERLRIALPSGHHISIAAQGAGSTLIRLLLAEKRAQVAANEAARIDTLRAEGARYAASLSRLTAVGTESSPTQQEIDHIANHASPRERCPFCRDEARRGVYRLPSADVFA